jgi:hypothetical protein
VGDGVSDAVAEPGLGRCLELLAGILARPGYAFSDGEVLANLRAVYAVAARVEAVKLAFVAQLAARPDVVPGSRPGRAGVTFLTEGLHLSGRQAARDVAAAAAIASAAPQLPVMGQALVEGEVSREHLDVAVATLARIPKALKTQVITEASDEEQTDQQADPQTDPQPDQQTDPRADSGGGVCRTGVEVIDEVLTGQARHLPPTTIERLGRQIVHRLDPARAERFDADAVQRRSCSICRDFAGMGLYRLVLDPVSHLQVNAVIARYSGPRPAGTAVTDTGEHLTVPDQRTPGQRRADAVVDLVLAGATALAGNTTTSEAPRKAGETSEGEAGEAVTDDATTGATATNPAANGATGVAVGRRPSGVAVEICVIATLDQLAAAFGADDPAARTAGLARITLAGRIADHPGATLPPAVLARLACDNPIRRILTDPHGAILNCGRTHRFATPAQRRALAARDGGCVVPGCPLPPEWTDAHHLTPWNHDGHTDLDNLVLLCNHHHTAHHAGHYDIQLRDGIPWVRPPTWQNPARPWQRNLTHHHPTLADTTAHRLTPPPPPTTSEPCEPCEPEDPWASVKPWRREGPDRAA